MKAETFIENSFFAIYMFKHKDWHSYVYLNKRNNRAYNIQNDDHGSFKILNNDKIQITWDRWSTEKFIKIKDKNFFEKLYD